MRVHCAARNRERNRKFAASLRWGKPDSNFSSLSGSVPLRAGGTVGGNTDEIMKEVIARGTDSSYPFPSSGESGAKPILSARPEDASGIVGMELSPHMELGSGASDVMASAVPGNEDPLPVASREVELEGSGPR